MQKIFSVPIIASIVVILAITILPQANAGVCDPHDPNCEPPPPPPREECECDDLKVKPLLNTIKVDAKKEGASVSIKITSVWQGEIICKGDEGNCKAKFLLDKSAANLKESITAEFPDGSIAQIVPGSESFKVVKGGASIECDGPCPPKMKKGMPVAKIHKFKTEYKVKLESPVDNIGLMAVSGDFTLEIKPDPGNMCNNESGWKMIIQIDGNPKKTTSSYDVGESDWDGDGIDNNNDPDRDGDGVNQVDGDGKKLDKHPNDPTKF
jgi:hypothetical protein